MPPTTTATITPTATALSASAQKWGTGNDGDLIVSGTFNLNQHTNSYNGRSCADGVAYSVTSLASTVAYLSTSPNAGNAGCLNPGDEVMLINLQGTSASTYNTGVYEFLRVASVSGSSVFFTTMKTRWYGSGFHSDANIGTGANQQKVMLIRIPNYANVTVNGILTSNAWNGTLYGVTVFRVNGTLSGSAGGVISANGKGFRGGTSQLYAEGYAGYLVEYGGGQKGGKSYYAYSGYGGGGAYGTNGTRANLTNNDGAGGEAYGNIVLNPIFFGAGGGAGGEVKQFNPNGLTPPPTDEPGGPGGPGGGIVFTMAQTINNFQGSVQSTGANGADKGAGGAGGSIRIEAGSIQSLSLNALGVNRGGAGRIAVYYETGFPTLSSNPVAFTAVLGQPATPTPIPTSINITPTPVMWSTGADGDLTVASGLVFNLSTENSNTRTCTDGGDGVSYRVVSLGSSWAKLSVTPANKCLKVGDEILLINQQGSGTNYTNAGNHEFLRIGGIVGDTVYFTNGKTKFYGTNAGDDSNIGVGAGQQRVSIIRVPNYDNVTVNGTLTGSPWNDYNYGLIVFRVKGQLTGTGTISANSMGYAGGPACFGQCGGPVGESFNDNVVGYGGGRGGGGCPIGAGGGGGYGTAGTSNGGGKDGAGGVAYGNQTLNQFFLGSGGGASGGINNYNGEDWGDAGTAGGGGVYVLGATINFQGSIQSKGTSNGGAGGTGSGGSIRIEGNVITLNSPIVTGGTTGSAGVGGLGRIAIYYATSLTNSTTICAQASTYCQNTGSVTPTNTPTPTATPTDLPSTNPGTTNLIAWWMLSEAGGTRNDSHTSGNHLTDINSVGSGAGKQGGTAADFEKDSSQYLSVASNSQLQMSTSDIYIAAWIKAESFGSDYPVIVAKRGTTNAESEYLLRISPNRTVDFIVWGTTGDLTFATSTTTLVAGQWYFVEGWTDKANRTVYVNVNNSTPVSATWTSGENRNNTSSQALLVGARYNTSVGEYWDGLIDEVSFYKRVLTSAERTWLYNNGNGRTYTDLTASSAGGYANEYVYAGDQPHAVAAIDRVNFTDAFTYDENGNMTCRVESGITYLQTYNTENRIASVAKLASGSCATPGNYAAKWDFTYDGDGVRTATLITPYNGNGQPQTPSLTRYFFGGALETTGSDVTKYYSFAGQTVAMKDSEGVKYFLTDHLGSILATLSNTGTLISKQRYLPFGAPRTDINGPYASPTDYGYTGQRKLDSGMGGIMDYKARFYSPYINQEKQPSEIISGGCHFEQFFFQEDSFTNLAA